MDTVAHPPAPAKHPLLARLLRRRPPVPVQHPYLVPAENCGHPFAPVPTEDKAVGWCSACGTKRPMPRIAA